MPYQSQVPVLEHDVIKSQKVVNAVIGTLKEELVLPNLFRRQSMDAFKGAEGETITQRFPGHLPYREYSFRNDRTDPIIFDVLTEATATITVSGRIYSATRLTDEQRDFDDLALQNLVPAMSEAVVNGITEKAQAALAATTFPVVIGGAEANLRSALIEARKVLNALRVPVPGRTLLVGSDFESALLLDDKIVLAQNAGDQRANSALGDATLGRLYGFNVILDQSLAPGEAVAFQADSFSLFTGAASVPRSMVGATKTYEGYALRYIESAEHTRFVELASVDAYVGAAPILDRLITWDKVNKIHDLSDDQHFVRGIKLRLEGTSVYPTVGSDIALYSKLDTTKAWTA